MYYEDINVTKRKTITNGEKYDFYIYNMLSLEKQFSNGKFGKGDTVISKVKDFKMLDDETGEMLEVKLRCSKKLDDALEGLDPTESTEVFNKCLKELENRGLVRDWFNLIKNTFSFREIKLFIKQEELHLYGVLFVYRLILNQKNINPSYV